MTTSELGALGMIGFVFIWVIAGYLGLRAACREQQMAPDWLREWDL